jgi:ribose transport system permease protein
MSQNQASNVLLMKIFKQYGGIFLSLIILCVIFSIMNPRFMSVANFMNVLQQVAVIAIAAFGMTWVILLGEIDLSIGSIIAVAGMVGAQCFAYGLGFAPALVLTLLAGALMGLINGVLTAKLLLPSFIVTVATMGIYRGLVSLPTNGAPAMIMNETWTAIGTESFLGFRSSSGSCWSCLFSTRSCWARRPSGAAPI